MQTLVDMVGAGLLHAAAVSEFVGWEVDLPVGVERYVVDTEPVFVVMAPHHPLADQQEIELADLADERWVVEPGDLDRELDVFVEASARAGMRPQVDHTLRGATALAFIRDGGRIGLCYPTARFDGLVTRPLAGSPIQVRNLVLVGQRSPLQRFATRLARAVERRLDAESRTVPAYADWLDRQRPLTSVG